MLSSKLADFDLPEFGLPKTQPMIGEDTYHERFKTFKERAVEEGFTSFIVYGDREHNANIAYLTGYDPRFEESMLVVDLQEDRSTIIVGHEGIGYLPVSPIHDSLEPVLYPSFSLMGQHREQTPPLKQVLSEAGVESRDTVGVAGWKYFTEEETSDPGHTIEIPSYIVDTLREIVGSKNVVNANNLFMHPAEGLRVVNEVDQLAFFEFAAAHTSQAVRNVVFGLKPGLSEFEAVQLMGLTGLPLNCHLMLSAGPRAFMGLGSPSSRTIKLGDPFTTAYGVFGALNCRAGWVVEDESQLPEGIRDYVDRLVSPYFEAIVKWLEHVGLGVEGGSLYKLIHERIGDPFFGVNLNPGHLIHLEEWLNSPIYAGSKHRLKSGMALQVDVIPATGTEYFTTNMEDGIALADVNLRDEFRVKHPEAWDRIQARKSFMREEVGIDLKPEVLPFSNIPSYLPPFLLSPWSAMKVIR